MFEEILEQKKMLEERNRKIDNAIYKAIREWFENTQNPSFMDHNSRKEIDKSHGLVQMQIKELSSKEYQQLEEIASSHNNADKPKIIITAEVYEKMQEPNASRSRQVQVELSSSYYDIVKQKDQNGNDEYIVTIKNNPIIQAL